MKIVSHIAAGLLAFVFLFASLNFFFHFVDMPGPPAGSPPALFMGAMIGSGYFKAIKILEIIGAILVLIPRLRSLGLLVLGPIVVNILLFHVFLLGGAGMFPLPFAVAALSAFLLWTKRASFAHLIS